MDWLQYAIASIIIKDLFHSRKYFETAYSFAEEIGFDTYQIDNHFARFLLVEAIDGRLDVNLAMSNFRDANNIISRQITNEKLYYPYKVAVNYLTFFNRFQSQLDLAQVDEISIAAHNIEKMIKRLSIDRSNHRSIIQCLKNTEKLIGLTDIAKREKSL